MAETLAALPFAEIGAAREELAHVLASAPDVETAAVALASAFRRLAKSYVLARVFLVVPEGRLPPGERAWAETFAAGLGKELRPATPVLALLATAGNEPAWNDRTQSAGHRAIPLLDRSFVDGAPMIAALLSSFKIDVAAETHGGIKLRAMPGGLNARFLVEDSATALDSQGRHIIAARDFVARSKIRSVFGMGGTYVGGELAAAVFFTTESLTAAEVDRFTPFISTFKMATADSVRANRIFARPT